MLCYGGYPLFPTSNQGKKQCPDCGRWYEDWLDVCPYCLGEGDEYDIEDYV